MARMQSIGKLRSPTCAIVEFIDIIFHEIYEILFVLQVIGRF